MQKGLNFFNIQYNEKTVNKLCSYALELKKWNERMNLTGLKEINRIVSELLYDAFFLYGYMQEMKSILDLGSGAGILAIPIAILNENFKIISVDKSLKKIQFQRHIKRTMHLKNFTAAYGRVEALDSMEVDAMLVKGFGSIEAILESGGRHIRTGGCAFILKGKGEDQVIYRGFELDYVMPYTLPVSDREYRLFVYKKQ
ncbi:MAG: class I SAM-dependent methyltransferase [Proteobacteria bacterium]|nr:class I SAM-dependent methyltransferase [Pseudomonadota bacterium]